MVSIPPRNMDERQNRQLCQCRAEKSRAEQSRAAGAVGLWTRHLGPVIGHTALSARTIDVACIRPVVGSCLLVPRSDRERNAAY